MLLRQFWPISYMALAAAGSTPEELVNGYFYNTVFQIDANGQADGTSYATEEGFMANTFTYQGNAAIASNVFTFDGTGDYIECSRGNNMLWVPGSSLTLELRDVKFNSAASNQVLISSYNASGDNRCWMLIWDGTSLKFTQSTDGAAQNDIASYSWTPLTDGTAYKITCTWDGLNVRLYVNNQYVAGGAFTGTFFLAGQALRIGCNFSGGAGANFFNGTIRAVRVTKGRARLVGEGAISLPTLPWPTSGSTTDANYPDVVLLAGYDSTMSRVRDFGPYDWALPLSGNAAGTGAVTLADGTGSIALDGTGDYIQLWDDALFEFGSGDWTVETFARHTVNNADHTYVSKYSTTADRSWAFIYRGASATDILEMLRSSNGTGTTSPVQSAAFTPTVDVFYHQAVCRDGSNHRIFSGGTQTGTTNTTAVTLFDGVAQLRIGVINSGGLGLYMNGYLAEVRITKGVARYTANFTAPTGVLPHE